MLPRRASPPPEIRRGIAADRNDDNKANAETWRSRLLSFCKPSQQQRQQFMRRIKHTVVLSMIATLLYGLISISLRLHGRRDWNPDWNPRLAQYRSWQISLRASVTKAWALSLVAAYIFLPGVTSCLRTAMGVGRSRHEENILLYICDMLCLVISILDFIGNTLLDPILSRLAACLPVGREGCNETASAEVCIRRSAASHDSAATSPTECCAEGKQQRQDMREQLKTLQNEKDVFLKEQHAVSLERAHFQEAEAKLGEEVRDLRGRNGVLKEQVDSLQSRLREVEQDSLRSLKKTKEHLSEAQWLRIQQLASTICSGNGVWSVAYMRSAINGEDESPPAIVRSQAMSGTVLYEQGCGETDIFPFDWVIVHRQEEQVASLASGLALAAMRGRSILAFADGPSGAGKSFLMFRGRQALSRMVATAMCAIASCISEHHRPLLQCSFVEIYNNAAFDLLKDRAKLTSMATVRQVRCDPASPEMKNFHELATHALKARSKHATPANPSSSRGHILCTLTCTNPTGQHISSVRFLDLAGSETPPSKSDVSESAPGRTKAAFAPASDAAMTEAKEIRLSRQAFLKLVSALEKGEPKGPNYNQKLVNILQPACESGSAVVRFACINPLGGHDKLNKYALAQGQSTFTGVRDWELEEDAFAKLSCAAPTETLLQSL